RNRGGWSKSQISNLRSQIAKKTLKQQILGTKTVRPLKTHDSLLGTHLRRAATGSRSQVAGRTTCAVSTCRSRSGRSRALRGAPDPERARWFKRRLRERLPVT